MGKNNKPTYDTYNHHNSHNSHNTANIPIMYIGIPLNIFSENGGIAFSLKFGQVFNNGLPNEVLKQCQSDPNLRRVFVAVGESARKLNAMRNPNSDISHARAELTRQRNSGRQDRQSRQTPQASPDTVITTDLTDKE